MMAIASITQKRIKKNKEMMSMIKYTEENIKKLEEVYRIMMAASNLQNTAKRNQEILKAGELLGEVGLVSNADSVQQITAAYNNHVLGRIREIIRKASKQKSNN